MASAAPSPAPTLRNLEDEAPNIFADLYNELEASRQRVLRRMPFEPSSLLKRFFERAGIPEVKDPEVLQGLLAAARGMVLVMAEQCGYAREDILRIATARAEAGLSELPDMTRVLPDPVPVPAINPFFPNVPMTQPSPYCTPITTPNTITARPATTARFANIKQPPAASSEPVLMPT